MVRETLFVAARQRAIAESLVRFFRLFFPNEEIQHQIVPLVFSCFADLSQQIEETDPEQLRHAVLLLDATQETTNVWSLGKQSPLGVAAHFVLAYPEIYPIFVLTEEQFASTGEEFKLNPSELAYHAVRHNRLHDALPLIANHAYGFRTLFDATGIRSRVRLHLFKATGVHSAYEAFSAARSKQQAAVADEETSFVYLNAYGAYTSAYATWLATSKREFSRLLGLGRTASSPEFETVISDWQLVYPDDSGYSPDPEHLNDDDLLIVREKALDWPAVKSVIVVTSFPGDVRKPSTCQEGWEKRLIKLAKPYGGLFRLIGQRMPDGSSPLGDSRRDAFAGSATGDLREQKPSSRHNAPYQCTVIASHLLHRWRRAMDGSGKDTETFIQAAVLANDAKEILGGLSQTMAYEALACQNESEVQAEVSFLGVSSELDVITRLKVLEAEAAVIIHHEARTKSARADSRESNLNFLMQTANRLRLRLMEVEQVDASEECLRHFARYSREADLARIRRRDEALERYSDHPVFASYKRQARFGDQFVPPPSLEAIRVRISWAVSWYVDMATAAGTSIFRLFAWSVAWILVFGGIFALMLSGNQLSPGDRVELGLSHSAMAFIQIASGIPSVERMIVPEPEQEEDVKDSPPGKPPERPVLRRTALRFGHSRRFHFEARLIRKYELALFIELLISYLHLGLLVAVVHRRITRRAP
jgi:hypothetical protein